MLCERFKICNSTITSIKKNEKEIREDCLNRGKKRSRQGKFDELENYLVEWFIEKRRQNLPINGPILCAKASEFSKMCLDESCKNFKPSNGWLGRFKKRNNIRWKKWVVKRVALI